MLSVKAMHGRASLFADLHMPTSEGWLQTAEIAERLELLASALHVSIAAQDEAEAPPAEIVSGARTFTR